MMWDWIKFIAVVLALLAGAVVLVRDLQRCKATGGVVVGSACVRTI